MSELYKDEKYWKRRGKKLLGRFYFTDFTVASIGIRMDLIKPGRFWDHRISTYDNQARISKAIEHTRENVATLLYTDSNNIQFSFGTTRSFELAIKMTRFEPADEIITTSDEYGSIDHVMNFTNTKIIRIETDNELVSKIESAITDKTKLIVASHITHSTCKVLPVKEISEIAKKHKIPFYLDAAQSVGHIDVNVQEINPDVLVSCGHKWLRGDLISGILYISPEYQQKISLPPPICFSSPYGASPNIRSRYTSKAFGTIEREIIDYDGYGNSEALIQLGMALDKHFEPGILNEFQRIKYLGDILSAKLSENRTIEIPYAENPAPGMIPFRVKGRSIEEIANVLAEKYKIGTTTKEDRDIIRISPSPFNTVEQIEKLVGALGEITDS